MKYRATLRRLKRSLPQPQPKEIRVRWVCAADTEAAGVRKEDEQTHNSSTSVSPHSANLTPSDSK